MLNTLEKDFEMFRGDSLIFGVELCKLTRDLDAAYFSVKKNKDDEEYVFQRTLEDGITKVKQGVYRVRVAPENTSGVEPGQYFYDLKVRVENDVKTVLFGDLDIHQDITNN